MLARTAISTIAAAPVSSTAAATATAVTTSTTPTAAALFPRASFSHGNVTPVHVLAVQGADGGLRFLRLGHGDKSESARTARDAIGDKIDVFHDSVSGEKILQAQFRGVEGKVPDKQFVVHDDSNCLD